MSSTALRPKIFSYIYNWEQQRRGSPKVKSALWMVYSEYTFSSFEQKSPRFLRTKHWKRPNKVNKIDSGSRDL